MKKTPGTIASEPNRLSDVITEAMKEKGLGINDLAKQLDTSYEHMRRIVRGEGTPSKFVLKALCLALKLPYRELQDLVSADAIQRKYGTLPLVMAGKKPGMEPLERVWDDLTEQQQQDILAMAQSWAKRAKSARTA